jgi:hypothetical protein
MMSPDGKYVWNGHEWVAVAVSSTDAGHLGVFPSWSQIAEPPAPAAAVPARPVAVQPPAIQYPPHVSNPLDYSAGGAVTPLWEQRPKSGMTNYLYIGAGAIAVVVVLVLLNTWGPLLWSLAFGAPEAPIVVKPTPPLPALTARTEYARADRFVTRILNPAMTDLNQAMTLYRQTCTGALTTSCQNNIIATEAQVKNTMSLIDHAQIPVCISGSVARMSAELAGMDKALQAANKAYNDNSQPQLAQALAQFAAASRQLPADNAATVAKTGCDTQATGP